MVDKSWFHDEEKQKEIRASPITATELLCSATRKLAKLAWSIHNGVLSVIHATDVIEDVWNDVAMARVWTNYNNQHHDLLLKMAQNDLTAAHTVLTSLSILSVVKLDPSDLDACFGGVMHHLTSTVVNMGYVIIALDNLMMRVADANNYFC